MLIRVASRAAVVPKDNVDYPGSRAVATPDYLGSLWRDTSTGARPLQTRKPEHRITASTTVLMHEPCLSLGPHVRHPDERPAAGMTVGQGRSTQRLSISMSKAYTRRRSLDSTEAKTSCRIRHGLGLPDRQIHRRPAT